MFHYATVRRLAPSAAGRLHSTSLALQPPPPRRPVPDILPICAAAPTLSATKQAHAIAITHGLLPSSVSIAAALILSYAAHHSNTSILQSIFDQTVSHSRSPFLHNTFIRACAILPKKKWVTELGILLYNNLLSGSRFKPDDYTFPFVLKLCADCLDFWKGSEVHGRLIKAGFDSDLFVNNTLILLYGSCGDLTHARKVFDEMPERDLITWNTGIRVYLDNECFLQSIGVFRDLMVFSEFMPNVASVVSILPCCGGIEDEYLVGLIHCYVFKVGLDNEIRVGNALVDAYGKCGNMEAMGEMFDEMCEKNEVSWNSMIGGFVCNGFDGEVLDCFRAMVREGMKVNTVTIASVLPMLKGKMFDKGRELHAYSVRMGMDLDVFVANALLDMYAKWGRFDQASYIFDKMETRNVVSWNALIGNFAQNGLELDALQCVREMQGHGETPNSITLTNILPACARLSSLWHGREIHARSIRSGSTSDLFVANALADMYAKCGQLDIAQTVFNISPKDEVSYNILITGYSQTNECLNSITLFTEMETLRLNRDIVSYMGVLSACANIHALKEGKQIHAFAIRRLFDEHLFVANSLLDLYAKCGQISVAMNVFTRIPNKDTASWNTMILAFGMLGKVDTAINLFEAMKDNGVTYDAVSYIAVLSACSHGGLVEKGMSYFDDMVAQSIEPLEMHYACMVDLLGRCGLLQEAVKLITNISGEPGPNIWGALLGASRLHGNMELGCWAAERLLELKADQPGYYVLLSNMYADAGRWDESDKVRKLMSQRGVKKNPGCSWVQVRDEIHGFVAGEKLNPHLWRASIT